MKRSNNSVERDGRASRQTLGGFVDLRTVIERTFNGKAFARPLFYCFPGGLRFELSESGAPLDMVLQALAKAQPICEDIFGQTESLVVCFRRRAESSPFGYRKTIRELRNAGVVLPKARNIWLEAVEEEDWFDEGLEEWWLNIAFVAPVALVRNVLWCAFASDFGCIHPRPNCITYLFDLERGVMVFPYDDRGMDVVGPNHEVLSSIFAKHRGALLEYDMEVMLATFEPPNQSFNRTGSGAPPPGVTPSHAG